MFEELKFIDLSIFDRPSDTELCGVIVWLAHGYEVREVPNRSEQPRGHTKMLRSDRDKVVGNDLLVGYVHTHPRGAGASLSYADVTKIADGMVGIMYHPSSGSRIIYNNNGPLYVDMRGRKR